MELCGVNCTLLGNRSSIAFNSSGNAFSTNATTTPPPWIEGFHSLNDLIAVACFASCGVIINTLSLTAIFHARPLQPPLRLFVSLSMSDIFTNVAYIYQVVFSVVTQYPQNFLGALLLLTSLISSFFNVLAIQIERFICIAFPLHCKTMVSNKKTNIGIILLWFGAISCAGLFAVGFAFLGTVILNIVLVGFWSIPLFSMFLLYIKVGIELRKLRRRQLERCSGAKPVQTTKGAVTAALIMGTFMLYNIPISVLVILRETHPYLLMNSVIDPYALYCALICVNMVNTILDPVIYGFRNGRVRHGFSRLFWKCRFVT